FVAAATLTNIGDIVLAPGVMYNFGCIQNKAGSSINLGVAVKAVVPIIPSAEQPTIVTKEKILAEPVHSTFLNAYSWDSTVVPATIENDGLITTALIDVPNNGVLGALSAPAYLDVTSYDDGAKLCSLVQFDNVGGLYFGGNGKLVLPLERNFNDPDTLGVILNCDSAAQDTAAHAGLTMTKSATAGGEATLAQGDVTVAYTTFSTSGPSFTATPASIGTGETVTLSGSLSAWTNAYLAQDYAPTFTVSGTNYSKTVAGSKQATDGDFLSFNFTDSFALSTAGTYEFTATVDDLDLIVMSTSVTVSDSGDSGGGGTTPTTPTTPTNPTATTSEPIDFIDVSEDDWSYEAIQFVTQAGYFLGTSEDTFSPTADMTRGMFMTVLARMDGQEINGEDWQEKGMEWASEKGVSDGSDPNKPITRQEIVTMLWRYAGSPEPRGDLSGRPDGDQIDSWAVKAAAWAIENGVMQGDENGYIHMRDGATRQEVAQFIMNYSNFTKK
ncbi:MAG: S-layer homology domain-containing protein, partial [Oscillospiraceae bacterium]|nr:S-layer homology domain-containing protein [Oscillospiraceae bacterium]